MRSLALTNYAKVQPVSNVNPVVSFTPHEASLLRVLVEGEVEQLNRGDWEAVRSDVAQCYTIMSKLIAIEESGGEPLTPST